MELLHDMWREGISRPLRAITVTAIHLFSSTDYAQTSLLGDEASSDKNTRLEQSVDRIRAKYGSGAITRGNLIKEIFDVDGDYDEDSKPFRRQ